MRLQDAMLSVLQTEPFQDVQDILSLKWQNVLVFLQNLISPKC